MLFCTIKKCVQLVVLATTSAFAFLAYLEYLEQFLA